MNWAIGQTAGCPAAKAVLLVLANYADENGLSWPSQRTIAEQTEQSTDSVQRHSLELERRGLIRRKRSKVKGRLSGYYYQLLMWGGEPENCSIETKTIGCGLDEKVGTDEAASCGLGTRIFPQYSENFFLRAAALEKARGDRPSIRCFRAIGVLGKNTAKFSGGVADART